MKAFTKTIAAGVGAVVFAGAAMATSVTTNISYGPGERNVLDLYLPEGVKNAPIVTYVHGGRWFRGDKDQIANNNRIEELTSRGIAIASINHTYSSDSLWPAQIDDVMLALKFVQENGATYGYNGDSMAVWGQSSGAHLALWAGLKAAEDPGIDVEAVVSWYAPSDLYNLRGDRVADAVPGENERHPEPSPETLLIGASVPDNKEEADKASATVYAANLPAGQELPDFLLQHGSADWVVSPLQSQRMYDILKAQGGADTVELRFVDGAGHGGDLFDPEAVYAAEFLAQRLAVQPVPVPGALPLLVAGLGVMGVVARRKRRQAA